MFECRACLSRSLRAIAGDVTNPQRISRGHQQLILTPQLSSPPIRRAASSAAATKDVASQNALGTVPATRGDVFGEDDGKKGKSLAKKDERALRTELKYLGDPVKLAEHVRYTLRCNNPEKALNLCRLASKQQEVIVSWNSCVDWYMAHGKIDEAIKTYNEMKKRAQFPDSYTYLLLLRGLARPTHLGTLVNQGNVTKALSIYNSMTNPNSRVRPAIIHTNAALKVCSTAMDMDALWSIAAKLPAKGKGAPDHVTYAILLHAIRHGAVGRNPDSHLEHIAARRQEAVNQGRRIWQEIIPKWRSGEVLIDEELVCAMGRLLLSSKRLQDWDDVFSLVNQTMDIERQIEPVGSAERHTEHVRLEDQSSATAEESPEDSEGYRDAPSTKAFLPVTALPRDSSKPDRPVNLAYVTPGNPTLSMLISTCSTLRTPKTASAYWNLLTSSTGPHRLNPDLQNFHAQFRLLGVQRASAQAVKVLRSIPDHMLTPTNMTFRIVMSVCVRDKNNHNVVGHAGEVVDEMIKQLHDPDIHTLVQYLNFALKTNDGAQIVAALDRLAPILDDVESRMPHGSGKPKSAQAMNDKDKAEAISLFQAIVGVIDTITNRALVPQENLKHWHTRRSSLTKLIGQGQGRGEQRGYRGFANEHGPLSSATLELKKLRAGEKESNKLEAETRRESELRGWDVRHSRRAERRGGIQKDGMRRWRDEDFKEAREW